MARFADLLPGTQVLVRGIGSRGVVVRSQDRAACIEMSGGKKRWWDCSRLIIVEQVSFGSLTEEQRKFIDRMSPRAIQSLISCHDRGIAILPEDTISYLEFKGFVFGETKKEGDVLLMSAFRIAN